MPDIQTELASLLQQVDRPGNFYVSGTLDIHAPRLEVEGVGPIALPLLGIQARQLIDAAEQAPYGRGSETLVDTQVRRTWQVDAERVHLGGRYWEQDLQRMLNQVATGLGIDGAIRAEFYKLLIYENENFFTTHRDTEKAPGMFATLVIVLPCDFQGGELVIRHKDEEAKLKLRPEDPAEAAFAAFYADCRHEVLPVTAGHRLTLIYNLIRDAGQAPPLAPDFSALQQRAESLLRAWADADEGPDKLIYPLHHAYTQAELAFDTLKGEDAGIASVLVTACAAADCDCHLVLLTIEEYGWAEYVGGGWDGEEAEYEIGEVIDNSWVLEHWRHPDGGRPGMGNLPFGEEEICPPNALDDLDDSAADFQEASGNEGVSFERFYQRAALVVWPRKRRARVLADGGLAVSLPFLTELVQRWEDSGDDAQRQQALELASEIRRAWAPHSVTYGTAWSEGQARVLLENLARLGDLEQRLAFLSDQVLAGIYAAKDNPALAELLLALEPARAADLLNKLISNNGGRQPAACAGLLRLCAERFSEPGILHAAATTLVEHLPDAATVREENLVIDSLHALERIDPALAQKALDHFLSLPAVYPMDALLLPAALAQRENASETEPTGITDLRHAVLAHLQRRIDEPLAPPADWRRAANVKCNCAKCKDLNAFLRAPDQPRWALKAAQADRSHVEEMIRRHRCDLDLTTEKKGRPYTLVCTKNQASYQRRVGQREQDLLNHERLSD